MKRFFAILVLLVVMMAALMGCDPVAPAQSEVPVSLEDLGSKIIFLITLFFASAGVKTILGLIAADVLSGVAASIRAVPRTFQWRKLADFYLSNVVPFILVYGGLYIAVHLVDPELMGGYADVVSEGLLAVVWTAIVYHLAVSVMTNLEEMGLSLGKKLP
jgi:hypothetical protein